MKKRKKRKVDGILCMRLDTIWVCFFYICILFLLRVRLHQPKIYSYTYTHRVLTVCFTCVGIYGMNKHADDIYRKTHTYTYRRPFFFFLLSFKIKVIYYFIAACLLLLPFFTAISHIIVVRQSGWWWWWS